MFDERQLQNLLLFLDRVKYKGLKEVQAIIEIIDILNCATKEKLEDKEGDKTCTKTSNPKAIK
jgi:hypothetical protein